MHEQHSFISIMTRACGFFRRRSALVLLFLLWPASAGAAETVFVNSLGMEFVLIPAGSFMQGASEDDALAMEDEKPRRQVDIRQPFYLGRYEVSQAQWAAVMGVNQSHAKAPNHPVEMVSWNDAQEFIHRMNQREGADKYRLPTEAEWEYAARAGSTGRYSFGDDPSALGDYAWYDGNAGKRHHPPGRKKPNAWGLHDMQGNVWELTQDGYSPNYAHDPALGTNPPEAERTRTARGGCYGNKARGCRLSARLSIAPDTRNLGVGLRLVRAAN